MGKGNRLMSIKVDLKGIKRLEKVLKEAPEVLRDELKRALLELGLTIEATAKKFCPVDTGLLRSSITPETVGDFEIHVGTNVEYAPYVEYGTKRTPAQPYFEPAYLDGKKQAPKVFGKAISRAIAKVERRMG